MESSGWKPVKIRELTPEELRVLHKKVSEAFTPDGQSRMVLRLRKESEIRAKELLKHK